MPRDFSKAAEVIRDCYAIIFRSQCLACTCVSGYEAKQDRIAFSCEDCCVSYYVKCECNICGHEKVFVFPMHQLNRDGCATDWKSVPHVDNILDIQIAYHRVRLINAHLFTNDKSTEEYVSFSVAVSSLSSKLVNGQKVKATDLDKVHTTAEALEAILS